MDAYVRWVVFLDKYFKAGILIKGYDKDLDNYFGYKSGLGDRLAMRQRTTFLIHTAFCMTAWCCVIYIAWKMGQKDVEERGMAVACKLQDRIERFYLKNGRNNFNFQKGSANSTPVPEMGLFGWIVLGEKRCTVLRN